LERTVSIVLVTGGCGFLGQNLVRELRARGHSVRILDLAAPDDLPGGVEFIRGSVLDAVILGNAMAQVRHVYHVAGIAQLWVRRKSDFEQINVRGTEMVLRAGAELGIERVVHCSTEAILLPRHGNPNREVDENVLPAFADMPGPYTRSKHRAEQAALLAAQRGLNVVIVNPTVPIGADDRNHTPPAAMLSMFLAGASRAFLDCVFNLVDVRDVAAGMILAAERGRSGERYVLGGETMTLRNLLALLEQISGRPMPTHALPPAIAIAAAGVAEWTADWVTGRAPMATREGVRLALRSAPFNSGKARQELGYAPRPVRDALEEAVRWLDRASGRR
jgi:hopanoid-associated sugar epimerase